MNNIKILAACLGLLAGLESTASCATNGVVNGQDFQSVINASAPGDTLIVQPGAYPDASLNFNKPLTVLPSGTNGDMMQFLGSIQVTGAGASSFQRAYFATNVQTAGSTVSFFDSYFNGPVTANGGKVTMKRTILNYPLTLTNNTALEALRMTNNAVVTATATAGSGTPFLAVQSLFNQPAVLNGYSIWLGYNSFVFSTVNTCLQVTNSDSVLIGNKFSGVVYDGNTRVYGFSGSGGTLKAYNNLIYNNGNSQWWTGIYLNAMTAEIVNNSIIKINVGYYQSPFRGVQVNGAGAVTLRGNIISLTPDFGGNSTHDITAVEGLGAASNTLFIAYCDLQATNTSSVGATGNTTQGVIPPLVNCLLQVNPNLASDGSPNASSPCINAGPPDAIYNNRDGTRNTMGYTGGPYWNPANYTNNNPMVFLLTGQQTVMSGAQTNIQVNVGASAGH